MAISLPRIYIETTIPSYLVARASRDVILAGQQETTRLWWEEKRRDYDLYVSELVLEETAAGDPVMAAARHATLAGLPQLAQTPAVDALATRLLEQGIIPPGAAPDAEHIALAAVHAMNFLLTWNCKHIANAAHRRRVEAVCAETELVCPIICTPHSLIAL
jgi:hypothetical protein